MFLTGRLDYLRQISRDMANWKSSVSRRATNSSSASGWLRTVDSTESKLDDGEILLEALEPDNDSEHTINAKSKSDLREFADDYVTRFVFPILRNYSSC